MSTDRTLAESVIALGQLSLAFGRVDRITYHEDGTTLESDTDHTVMLGLVACAFAARYPVMDLDLGLVAQFALVHDVVEVYAGDTPTLRINDAQRLSKAEREEAALARIRREFTALPWLASMIARYEERTEPEARYVKALDKLLPKITHILNGGKTLRDQGFTVAELQARYDQQLDELLVYAADFPALFHLRILLLDHVYETVDLERAS